MTKLSQPTPTWLKVLRAFLLFCAPVMVLNCWLAWQEEAEQLAEIAPVTAVLFASTHLVLRAPYRKWRHWEWPLVGFSVGLAGLSAFHFVPKKEEFQFGFQLFLAVFIALALSYGFFCTAVPKEHMLRQTVIAPTKRVAEFGLGLNLGLVAAPFCFIFFLVKHYARKASSS